MPDSATLQKKTLTTEEIRPIMKQNSKVLPDSQMWSDWQINLSADQLLPVVQASKYYLDIKSTDNEYYELYEDFFKLI